MTAVIAVVNSQVWWWLARASGIVAWFMATATIAWGLTLSGKLVRRKRIPAWLLDLHRYLGTLTLAFVGLHLAGLVLDSYVEFGLRELFVPMASTWQPGAVAWGIVAFYALLIVQVSSWLMGRLPRRIWNRLHMLSVVVITAGTVHGILAGTDRSEQALQIGLLVGLTSLVFLVLFRILNASVEAADDDRIANARAALRARQQEPSAA
jgi:DMSO/TMAO reductase YedYZ heme-binding membrane subunit